MAKLVEEGEILIGFKKFPFKEFKTGEVQCFKCQKFGHTATMCQAKKAPVEGVREHIYLQDAIKKSNALIVVETTKLATLSAQRTQLVKNNG